MTTVNTTARRAIAGAATILAAIGIAATATGTAAAADTASVSGTVWFDRDYDGRQSADEPGYRSFGSIVLQKDGAVVGYYDTDADGHYAVDGLAPGRYRVANLEGGTYAETTPSFVDVDLADGTAATADFGIKGGSVAGDAWLDANGNHARDEGEGAPDGAAGAGVHLIGPAGLELDTTLDEDGHYVFHDLPNGGNYQIVAPALPGMEFLTMTNDSQIDPTTGMSDVMSIWRGTPHVVAIGYATA
jgi:SdrD B-like protein